jgi:hypothetical protein
VLPLQKILTLYLLKRRERVLRLHIICLQDLLGRLSEDIDRRNCVFNINLLIASSSSLTLAMEAWREATTFSELRRTLDESHTTVFSLYQFLLETASLDSLFRLTTK